LRVGGNFRGEEGEFLGEEEGVGVRGGLKVEEEGEQREERFDSEALRTMFSLGQELERFRNPRSCFEFSDGRVCFLGGRGSCSRAFCSKTLRR